MKCKECNYYWQDADDYFPNCKYDYDDGKAPYEVEKTEYIED